MRRLASHSADVKFMVQMGSKDCCYCGITLLSLSTVTNDPQNCTLPARQLVTFKSLLTCTPTVREPTQDCVIFIEISLHLDSYINLEVLTTWYFEVSVYAV